MSDSRECRGRFLKAEWRHLLMLNFEIAPAIVQPYVPRGTEIDFWNGKTFVSVVGFRFLNTKVLGIPIPFHRHFDEINLRFYVRRRHEDGWRRGVVFIKEIVPRWLISWVARTVYNENYVTRQMRSRIELPIADSAGQISYEWRRHRRWNLVAATIVGEPYLPGRDSEETFITEHYWGYVRRGDGGTSEYQVEHPPWRVWKTSQVEFDCDANDEYGAGFAETLARPPTSVFVAEGSPILVRQGECVE